MAAFPLLATVRATMDLAAAVRSADYVVVLDTTSGTDDQRQATWTARKNAAHYEYRPKNSPLKHSESWKNKGVSQCWCQSRVPGTSGGITIVSDPLCFKW